MTNSNATLADMLSIYRDAVMVSDLGTMSDAAMDIATEIATEFGANVRVASIVKFDAFAYDGSTESKNARSHIAYQVGDLTLPVQIGKLPNTLAMGHVPARSAEIRAAFLAEVERAIASLDF